MIRIAAAIIATYAIGIPLGMAIVYWWISDAWQAWLMGVEG